MALILSFRELTRMLLLARASIVIHNTTRTQINSTYTYMYHSVPSKHPLPDKLAPMCMYAVCRNIGRISVHRGVLKDAHKKVQAMSIFDHTFNLLRTIMTIY